MSTTFGRLLGRFIFAALMAAGLAGCTSNANLPEVEATDTRDQPTLSAEQQQELLEEAYNRDRSRRAVLISQLFEGYTVPMTLGGLGDGGEGIQILASRSPITGELIMKIDADAMGIDGPNQSIISRQPLFLQKDETGNILVATGAPTGEYAAVEEDSGRLLIKTGGTIMGGAFNGSVTQAIDSFADDGCTDCGNTNLNLTALGGEGGDAAAGANATSRQRQGSRTSVTETCTYCARGTSSGS